MRIMLSILFIALAFLVFSWQFSMISKSGSLTNSVVVSEGESIQAAINNAAAGDTIFVKNGTYSEQILVNKSVSLIGESLLGVTFDGKGEYTYVVNVVADDVRLEQFTIRNGSPSFGSTIIHILNRSNITIQNCKIEIGFQGILITNSRSCRLFNNKISRSNTGIKLHSNSEDNTLNGNLIFNNTYGIYVDTSIHNLIFHNNFIDNIYSYWTDTSENYWNNNYPSGGNYWSDYSGLDQNQGLGQNITGPDGLGDSPYPYEDIPLDDFPYVNSISIELYSYNNYTYYFLISTDLTILDFNFQAENESTIEFVAQGVNGTQCSCRVMIPRRLLLFNTTEEWIVTVNNDSVTGLVEEDTDSFFLYFSFNMGQESETVKIIPIYTKAKSNLDPLILLSVALVLAVLILGVVFYVRRRHEHKQSSLKGDHTLKATYVMFF